MPEGLLDHYPGLERTFTEAVGLHLLYGHRNDTGGHRHVIKDVPGPVRRGRSDPLDLGPQLLEAPVLLERAEDIKHMAAELRPFAGIQGGVVELLCRLFHRRAIAAIVHVYPVEGQHGEIIRQLAPAKRWKREGTSFLLLRSPAPPMMTSVNGSTLGLAIGMSQVWRYRLSMVISPWLYSAGGITAWLPPADLSGLE